jgi:23S rRNA (cytidine1920-2'-O)/16S rRNA (cytidine1409-2'-O)-methyltransferase
MPRLDQALAERGMVESRSRAQALIMAGRVRVNDATERRPDRAVKAADELTVDTTESWASRGALKLAPALDAFGVDPAGRVCADIGASTGGFTDLLLRRGASRVYAVDVGRGLLDWKLRQDPRVVLMDRTNARDLAPFSEPVTLLTVDVSFIGLEKVLPALRRSAPEAELVALYKPQFELPRTEVGAGGVVRDDSLVEHFLASFRGWCEANGYRVVGQAPAGLRGADGNQEYFLHLVPAN